MDDKTKLAMILKSKYDIDPIFIGCFENDEQIKEMLDILLKHPEITDSDEVYTISAKVVGVPCKPVNEKLKGYMEKWGVKVRTAPWCKD